MKSMIRRMRRAEERAERKRGRRAARKAALEQAKREREWLESGGQFVTTVRWDEGCDCPICDYLAASGAHCETLPSGATVHWLNEEQAAELATLPGPGEGKWAAE